MLTERAKRVMVKELDSGTIMDLLNQLPKRLLEIIIKRYGLTPVDASKSAMVLVIAENRKTVFRTLKFTFSYDRNQSQISNQD